jgi:uncharacterized protein (TIGR03437 family)
MRSTKAVRIASGVVLSAVSMWAQVITTVAGTDWSFPVSSLPALSAPLGNVQGIALDAKGNIYVADNSNNMIMRVSPDGTLTVVAGNGILGCSGDGGPATRAAIARPVGLALDASGNLYITDGCNLVRKVTPDGTITTVAGNGVAGFAGDGGPATSAALWAPWGVTVDASGNFYIGDRLNNRVRKVTPSGTITTVAGSGPPGFSAGFAGDGGSATIAKLSSPHDVALDPDGNLYIADYGNNRIRKVAPNGTITTAVGSGSQGYSGDGGPATRAALSSPSGVNVDAFGNLNIADSGNNRVRRVTPNGPISTVAGTGVPGFSGDGGPATGAALFTPSRVVVDAAGNLYISDFNNHGIRKVTASGTITTMAGNGRFRFSGDGGPATSAVLNSAWAAAIDTAGNLYISDYLNDRIRKVTPRGTITTIAGNGIAGFAGDGGPATSAALELPRGVAVDAAGNVYIADGNNNRIRKATVTGTITTVAGDGISIFSGDGGLATKASLANPGGMAVDAAGSLYIATFGDNRVRRVTPQGTITTVAGNGAQFCFGYSPPQSCPCPAPAGPFARVAAASVVLNSPYGLAVDTLGNIYISDFSDDCILKVTPDGILTTVAGSLGFFGFSGDGGPATTAALNNPTGVSVDAAENLYIADLGNNRIRKATAGGTITTIAGNGTEGFSGDGGLATNAALNSPQGVVVDAAGNLYIVDTGNNRIRLVLASPPSLSGLPQSVNLNANSGGKAASGSLVVSATLNQQSSTPVPGIAYTVEVGGGSPWLTVTPQSGRTPGLIMVKADPFSLEPGVYQGTITITVPLANPSVRTVNVQFTVGQPVAANLAVDHDHLSFSYANTSATRGQTVTVSNQGGGPLAFTTSVVPDSGQAANWLTVTPPSGTATPSSPVVLNVRADPSNLPPGTYTGRVTIAGMTSGTGLITIPVAMTITANPLILLLSQTGLTFTAVQNGGAIPVQTFGVLNLGSGVLNWTVQTSTLAGGSWLMATPNNGTSDAASTSATPLVTVSVNPAGLQPGVYYGLVKLVSQGAANTPQEVVVVLQVLQAGTDVEPIVQPSSLVFTGTVGNSSPGSQNVQVYDPTGTNKSFRSGKTTVSGGSWFVTLPGDATIAPNQPAQIVLQPVVDNLGPGTYQGTLTLQFSDGRVSTVGITFIVMAERSAGTSDSVSRGSKQRPAVAGGGCTPTQLLPSLISLGTGFTVPAGYPQGLEAEVVDDCGTPHLSGSVFVQFTNGDPPVKLSSLNNGRWDGTWQTSAKQVSQVTLTVTAQNPDLQIKGEADVSGGLGAPQPAPVVDSVVSVVNPAPNVPIAPGGLVSILGQRLSDSQITLQNTSLPLQLGNTIVTIGDQQLPLSASGDSQLSAVVPFGVNINTNQQLLVQRDTTYATPVSVDIAAAQPGILQNGQQAMITDAQGNLIGLNNPAHAGDPIVIYCVGLGAVNPPIGDGMVTPDSPSSATVNAVSVSIGGRDAPVSFAGLLPGFVGVYQISVSVPQGVTAGDQVPTTVTAAGQTSAGLPITVR